MLSFTHLTPRRSWKERLQKQKKKQSWMLRLWLCLTGRNKPKYLSKTKIKFLQQSNAKCLKVNGKLKPSVKRRQSLSAKFNPWTQSRINLAQPTREAFERASRTLWKTTRLVTAKCCSWAREGNWITWIRGTLTPPSWDYRTPKVRPWAETRQESLWKDDWQTCCRGEC